MVTVCQRAALLLSEEIESDAEIQQQAATRPAAAESRSPPPLARAQSAGSEYSGVSASRVASTTRDILNAVSFPRFVTELINGVFKAMVDSNRQQMQGYVELLNNVAASTNGFADSNLGPDRAREWLAERYPDSFTFEGGQGGRMGRRAGSSCATRFATAARRRDAFAGSAADRSRTWPGETVPTGDPEQRWCRWRAARSRDNASRCSPRW